MTPDNPMHQADWGAYQARGQFYFLARLVVNQIAEYGGLETCVAEALSKHLTEYCAAETAEEASEILGLKQRNGPGGPSGFLRAKGESLRRDVVDAVDTIAAFENLETPGEPRKTDDFKAATKMLGMTPAYVKTLYYESKRK